MDLLVQVVGRYRERDKIIRLLQYVARFLAGSAATRMGKRLQIIATEFSKCRTVLRLFDDLPMLAYTLHYGLGRKETNVWMRCLELVGNCANQLYFPLEHVSWCCSNKIIDMDNTPWYTWCTVAWAVSLASEILKAITRISMVRAARKKLLKEQELESRNDRDSTEMPTTIKGQLRDLKAQEMDHYLAVVENVADFINAVNWLPASSRFLWAGKFTSTFSGGMGSISSAIKLYRLHAAKWKS